MNSYTQILIFSKALMNKNRGQRDLVAIVFKVADA